MKSLTYNVRIQIDAHSSADLWLLSFGVVDKYGLIFVLLRDSYEKREFT